MTYATQQDLVDRFGNDELLAIADRDGDGSVDAAVVDGALSDADEKPTRGLRQQRYTGLRSTIQFEVEMMGGGDAGTAPPWGPVALACGFAETVNVDTDVQYDPVSGSFGSASIYLYIDGTLHKVLGFRGNAQIVFRPNASPRLTVSGIGLHVDPAAAAMPGDADFSAFAEPLEINNENTPTFTLDGYAGVLRELTLDMRHQALFRNLVGAHRVDLMGRDPGGEIVIESPPLGTKDFFALAKGHGQGTAVSSALQIVHGDAAGQILQIDVDKLQLANPREEETEGVPYLRMDLHLLETDGDDELKITVK